VFLFAEITVGPSAHLIFGTFILKHGQVIFDFQLDEIVDLLVSELGIRSQHGLKVLCNSVLQLQKSSPLTH
jgi:hypothetical protein